MKENYTKQNYSQSTDHGANSPSEPTYSLSELDSGKTNAVWPRESLSSQPNGDSASEAIQLCMQSANRDSDDHQKVLSDARFHGLCGLFPKSFSFKLVNA